MILMTNENLILLLSGSLIAFVTWWMRIIRKKLVSHVDKEEKITWPKFQKQLNDNHLEVIRAVGNLDKRVALLERANGEMKELKTAMVNLSAQITNFKKS